MNGDLHFGYNGGLFAWLIGLCIALAVAIWVFWLVVFGFVVVAVIVLLEEAVIRWRAHRRHTAPARARRKRVRHKPYRVYY